VVVLRRGHPRGDERRHPAQPVRRARGDPPGVPGRASPLPRRHGDGRRGPRPPLQPADLPGRGRLSRWAPAS
jgi:hypothetical protein